ncbi:hypothetical protein DL96DRAFT_1596013 [Flagelloscypha sp. PMI_526]|nr:hypothetical protein DL96DRAFT_1596013 [Flagelloscypha sp. PMI_526]
MKTHFNARRQWRKLSISIIFLNTVMFAASASRRKMTLLIGISNIHPEDKSCQGTLFKPLNGPWQDVPTIKRHLLEKYYFYEENITVMADEDGVNP